MQLPYTSLVLTAALFVLPGCPGSSNATDETTASNGSTSGPGSEAGSATGVPGACSCLTHELGANGFTCEPGIECGDYIEHEDGTGEPCSEDPTGTTGGETPGCEQELAGNEMVAECVLAAAAAGDAVHLRRLNNPGNIEADYDDYWVRPGEPLYVRREEFRDLCDRFWGELRADPSFDACMGLAPDAAWACIYAQLTTEPTVDCGMWDGCEGT